MTVFGEGRIQEFRAAWLRLTKSPNRLIQMMIGAAGVGDAEAYEINRKALGYKPDYVVGAALLLAATNGYNEIIQTITTNSGGYSEPQLVHAAWKADRAGHHAAAALLMLAVVRDHIVFRLQGEAFSENGVVKLAASIREVFADCGLAFSESLDRRLKDSIVEIYPRMQDIHPSINSGNVYMFIKPFLYKGGGNFSHSDSGPNLKMERAWKAEKAAHDRAARAVRIREALNNE